MNKTYTEQLEADFVTKFPEGGVRDVVAKALEELEEFGQLHEGNCGIFIDENYPKDCDCDMYGMKTFVREKMEEVNNWWIKMATEHRKYCTPEGNKVLTRIMGKKNR